MGVVFQEGVVFSSIVYQKLMNWQTRSAIHSSKHPNILDLCSNVECHYSIIPVASMSKKNLI